MKRFIIGIFNDEYKVLTATKECREKSIPVYDVYTPYVIHGLDEAMGIKRSRLPYVTFIAGLIGCSLALFFQLWVFTVDWRLVIGGKPYNSLPAFIPVTFEVTILLGGIATALAFFIRARLRPRINLKHFSLNVTDDQFVIAIHKKDASFDDDDVTRLLYEHGATHVEEVEAYI